MPVFDSAIEEGLFHLIGKNLRPFVLFVQLSKCEGGAAPLLQGEDGFDTAAIMLQFERHVRGQLQRKIRRAEDRAVLDEIDLV